MYLPFLAPLAGSTSAHGMIRAAFLFAVVAALATALTTVDVQWNAVLHPLKTVAGFQTVVNPMTSRDSPDHDAVYSSIAELGAQYQRYVP
jgi:hypothetical protein